ncbi:MAG: hypothetical protein WBE68_10575 [Candidatus Nitrosopolaris sp.]
MHGSVEVEFAKRGTFVFAGPLLVVGVIVGLEPSAGYQEIIFTSALGSILFAFDAALVPAATPPREFATAI